jgi:hypothetical protein
MSASRAVRRSVIAVLGFVFLHPGSTAAQPAATAPRTLELAALQRAAIESDPRMRQLRLLVEHPSCGCQLFVGRPVRHRR